MERWRIAVEPHLCAVSSRAGRAEPVIAYVAGFVDNVKNLNVDPPVPRRRACCVEHQRALVLCRRQGCRGCSHSKDVDLGRCSQHFARLELDGDHIAIARQRG